MVFDSDLHKTYYREYIGGFVIAFEAVCNRVRLCITFALCGDGLKHQVVGHAVTADLTAGQLHNMLIGITGIAVERQNDEHLEKVAKVLLKRFRKVIEIRNEFLHSHWSIDHVTESDNIARLKFKNSFKGPIYSSKESNSPSLSEIYKWINEAENLDGFFLSFAIYLHEAFKYSPEDFVRPILPGRKTPREMHTEEFVFENGKLKEHQWVRKSRFIPRHEPLKE